MSDPAAVHALCAGLVLGGLGAGSLMWVLAWAAEARPLRAAWRAYRRLGRDVMRLLEAGRWTREPERPRREAGPFVVPVAPRTGPDVPGAHLRS